MKHITILLLLLCISFGLQAKKKYLVIMTDEFYKPVIKQSSNSVEQENLQSLNKKDSNKNYQKNKQIIRDRINDKLDTFLRDNNIKKEKERFVEVSVGFIAFLSEAQKLSLENDNGNVLAVIEDYKVSFNGRRMIRQGRNRPIRQNRGLKFKEATPLKDYYNFQNKNSCAVDFVGGSKDGSGREKKVWILDSGIDVDHPDLINNVDLENSFNYLCGSSENLKDKLGHGTHVAGIVSGLANNNPDSYFSVNGVSKGATVVSLKVLNRKGEGSWFNVVLALNKVAESSIENDVVLMSFGHDVPEGNCMDSNVALRNSIQNLASNNKSIVMSAGNIERDNRNGIPTGENRASINLPGCINGPNIYTIAALDYSCYNPCSNLADYSYRGSPVIYALPGTRIISTFKNGQYVVWTGTSMAAAFMAGLLHNVDSIVDLDTTDYVEFGELRFKIPKFK